MYRFYYLYLSSILCCNSPNKLYYYYDISSLMVSWIKRSLGGRLIQVHGKQVLPRDKTPTSTTAAKNTGKSSQQGHRVRSAKAGGKTSSNTAAAAAAAAARGQITIKTTQHTAKDSEGSQRRARIIKQTASTPKNNGNDTASRRQIGKTSYLLLITFREGRNRLSTRCIFPVF